VGRDRGRWFPFAPFPLIEFVGYIFHHFPITRRQVTCKCRRSSEVRVTRGSLGSICSTTELRPLVVSDSTEELIFRTAVWLLDKDRFEIGKESTQMLLEPEKLRLNELKVFYLCQKIEK
jgi:hypothetical protein